MLENIYILHMGTCQMSYICQQLIIYLLFYSFFLNKYIENMKILNFYFFY